MATTGQQTASNKTPAKNITIVVNGRDRAIDEKELTFAEVVALAFDPIPSGPNLSITVTYRRGHGHKPEGSMVEGDTVKPKDGMIFNVSVTDKS